MTTRSTPDRSVSLCQTMRGAWPEDCASAIAMSRSRLIPGKTMMADFIVFAPAERQRRRSHASTETRKLSMTVLASSLRAISSAVARALAGSVSLSSSSMTLPARTSFTPAKPSVPRAWAMALPWGSSTPFFSITVTTAFTIPTSLLAALPMHSVSLHRLRAFEVAHAGLGQDAQTLGHFLVGFLDLPQVAAEAVLVHLLVGFAVPQTAIVRADLVGQDDPHLVVFPQPAEFQLEVHQGDADAKQQPGQEVVDAQGQRDDVVQVGGVRPAEAGDVLLRHQRVAEAVVLIIVLDDGAGQAGAFGNAEPLGETAGGDVAEDDLQRNDLHFADQLLAHVQPADEMRRDADLGQAHHQVFADAVVEDPFAGDDALLLRIECGRIVLKILDQGAGFRSLEQDLGFAFVELAAAGHMGFPSAVHPYRPGGRAGIAADPGWQKAGCRRDWAAGQTGRKGARSGGPAANSQS